MKPFFLPAGWEIKLFGQCIKKVKYTEKQPTKSFLPEGKFPIVSQEKELISGYSNNQNAVFSVKNSVVIFGDHTKVVKYIDFDFVIGADGVKILQPIEEINAKYFYYYLSHLHLRDLGYARHYKLLKECIVIYPPLPEQKRIVEKLDKIFATIDEAKQNIEKNLDNVKELFQRTLSHLFTHNTQGWEDKPLPDVCIFQSGTTIEKKYEKEKGDLLYVKVGDMNLPDNTFKINTSSRFALSSDISAKQILPIGAVIFPKRGGAIATNKKRQIVKPTIVDLNTMSIKCVEDIDDDFFFLWFQQIDLLSISNGTTIPQINNYSFKDLRIKYPHNIYEQKKIVNKLRILQEKVAQAQVSYTQKLADLEELKQAVLQQAFSGKL